MSSIISTKSKRGIMLFAFNNSELDYCKMAICCALSIKHNLVHNHVTLVTDQPSLDYMMETNNKAYKVFDNIIIQQTPTDKNIRTLYDSPWTQFETKFINGNRYSAYDLSPYDETLLIDVDYIVQSNALDMVWNSKEDVLINKSAVDLRYNKFHEKEINLSKTGIPMYWATTVYFKKSKKAELLFNMVQFIKENYSFYQNLYKFPGATYRNDYAFSIALHILHGFKTQDISLPIDTIITMDQKDDITEVQENNITFLSHDVLEPWKDLLTRVSTDVHIMNKRALVRHADKFIEVYK